MILFKLWSSNDQIIIWIVFEWRMEERIFNDFDTTRKLSFSTHVLFLWREFNLHARSRASNIHHCWRESKIKGRNRRKQGSNQRTFFIHVRTRRELIFSSTSFSVSNTSPRVFALHCFACYCFTSLQEEKNIQRGNVIVTRRENDHDNEYAFIDSSPLPIIPFPFGSLNTIIVP